METEKSRFGQALPVQGMQQPVVFYPARHNYSKKRDVNFKQVQSRFLGVSLILIGASCIAFNIVSVLKNDVMPTGYYTFGLVGYGCIGHGIWTGVLFIITGALGLGASCKKAKCLIFAFMVMCIISASAAAAMLSLGIVGAITASDYPEWFEQHGTGCGSAYYDYVYYYYYNYYDEYYIPPPPSCSVFKVVIAMESLMAIMALFGAIFTIWGSVLCCKAVCCCARNSNRSEKDRIYSCSNGQMEFGDQHQAFYVWPAPGSNGYQEVPPMYTPQTTVPAYSASQATGNATQC